MFDFYRQALLRGPRQELQFFAKTANIVKSAKNWKIRRVSENLYKKGLRGPQQEL